MLYFSYGSNMSIRRLSARTPSARMVDIATLYEHELKFHKKSRDGSAKCDAYETGNSNQYVIGVLFDIAVSEKPVLDAFEGLGSGYEEKHVTVVTPSNTIISAYTYYAVDIDPSLQPFHWYKYHVLTGARENGLPAKYTENINLIESVADPDTQRHALELAIYTNY